MSSERSGLACLNQHVCLEGEREQSLVKGWFGQMIQQSEHSPSSLYDLQVLSGDAGPPAGPHEEDREQTEACPEARSGQCAAVPRHAVSHPPTPAPAPPGLRVLRERAGREAGSERPHQPQAVPAGLRRGDRGSQLGPGTGRPAAG